MTVKDYASLKAAVSAALPDNVTRLVDPVDVRETGFIDTIDSFSLLSAGPITFATQQVGFTPQAAQTGPWRTVSDADFQDGLTMDGEDFVIFRNCKFGGPVVLGATTPCDRVKFVECTSTGVTGTFLTATACDRLTFEDILITDATIEGIKLDNCTNVRLVDVFLDGVTVDAASITFVTDRSAAFENPSNLSSPGTIFAAVHLLSCKTVTMDSVHFNNVKRTGLFVRQCSNITVRDIATEGGHLFVSSGLPFNDEPIMIHDSVHVHVSGGQILNSGRHGVWIHETSPATVAGGLGLLTNHIIIEKLHVQHNTVDDRSDLLTSFGIVCDGGSDITIRDNEVTLCGETGIEMANFGTDRLRVTDNDSHGNGQNALLVHWDGFSMQSGCNAVVSGNSFRDNYRSGLQLKPGYLTPTGGFHNEYPLSDMIIENNVITNNTRGNAGNGIIVTSSADSSRTSSSRITFSKNIVYQNDLGNIQVGDQSGDIKFVDNHIGESLAISNIKIQNSDNVWFIGGFIHSTANASQNQGLRFSDLFGQIGLSHVLGVHFQGVDVPNLNRRNTLLAVNEAGDENTETLESQLALATTTAGRDIRLYKHAESTTGGAVIRPLDEIQDADRANFGTQLDGEAPCHLSDNVSNHRVSNSGDILTRDNFVVEPAQPLVCVQAGGTGDTFDFSARIYVGNGFSSTRLLGVYLAANVTILEKTCKPGWYVDIAGHELSPADEWTGSVVSVNPKLVSSAVDGTESTAFSLQAVANLVAAPP